MFHNLLFRKNKLITKWVLGLYFVSSATLFSQPAISSFSPTSQLADKSVTINGSNFGSSSSLVTVKFGGANGTITSFSSTRIIATVPSGASSGDITVSVTGQTDATKSGFIFLEKINQLYTDFGGYWTSSETNVNSIKPDLSHNLLAFKYGSTVYSTGVSDTALTNRSISFTAAEWNAFPVNSLTGYGTDAVLLWAATNDGFLNTNINPNKKNKRCTH